MRVIPIVVVLGLFGPSAFALAANQTIHQAGRVFSSELTSVRKGEPIAFLNDDTVPHNVVSVSSGNEFDLGSQRPGTSTEVTFTKTGEVLIFCAIHPRMKMTIVVTE
ncbi:cupredoxin domain-containing protein [Bradyrhizobium sp.]|jgi:plastocyanin|uniref:cupredoxin domain-containing protein n=1 Tax=Bradyrhizobium sp. TaxID=376 RepID=UPI003C24DB70